MIVAMLAALALAVGGSPVEGEYQAGQVWEYRTRPQEPESRLRIQAVEDHPVMGRIYHISLTGLRLQRLGPDGNLAHAPVSEETLDASVTRLSEESPTFPDHTEGMEIWRQDSGGVFTISVADIVSIVDQMPVPPPPVK